MGSVTPSTLACSSVVEPRPVKPVVAGSSPAAPARFQSSVTWHLKGGEDIPRFYRVPRGIYGTCGL